MEAPSRRTVRETLATLFGFTVPVDRRIYAIAGFSLMALKLAGDQLILRLAGYDLLHPLEMVSLLRLFNLVHQSPADGLAAWTVQVLGLWSLPFAWIGLSMSMRRAMDAGTSPWLGLLFCVPLVNLVLMLGFCLLPSRPRVEPAGSSPDPERSTRESALRAVGAALLLMLVAVGLTLASSGSNLGGVFFVGLPLGIGAVVGFVFNRGVHQKLGKTLTLALGALVAGVGALLLFAVEGVVCLVMALPFALPLTLLGAALGRLVALHRPLAQSPVVWVMVFLPLLAWAEPHWRPAPERKVTTSVVIAAPPELVWNALIAFEPLPAPHELLFRLGIAYPTHARIEGLGVGAVRFCEFSTGTFVEPITVWDAPRRLAFDVAEQPEPLRELSPYPDLHLDHLDGTLASRRGEFLLTARADGSTLLQGTTWYELSLGPEAYWSLWTDAIIRTIHLRVLRHVAGAAQARSRAAPSRDMALLDDPDEADAEAAHSVYHADVKRNRHDRQMKTARFLDRFRGVPWTAEGCGSCDGRPAVSGSLSSGSLRSLRPAGPVASSRRSLRARKGRSAKFSKVLIYESSRPAWWAKRSWWRRCAAAPGWGRTRWCC